MIGVGVDIGCGMGAVQTSLAADAASREQLRTTFTRVKELMPCGEGRARKKASDWKDREAEVEACSDRGWLKHFKAKFRPQTWEPVFAMAAEPLILPATLYAVMGVFTGRAPLEAVGRAAIAGLIAEFRRRRKFSA